jgi:hypothetical protein
MKINPLSNISNLQDTTTSQTLLNANSASITTALNNTLSLDGSTPNQMQSNLDMNSYQILNLPAPSSVNSPARLIDVVSNPTIVVPGTGTSGHFVPFLDGNNTWSGTNTFNSTVHVGSLPISGSSSGVVSVLPQAAAGTYNFNLPTTAGSAGQYLTSQGGSSSAMTWTTNPYATGQTLLVGPSNPTGTTSTSPVMMGIGGVCHITPATSTRVFVTIQGQVSNNTTSDASTIGLRQGTGSAPANGAAATGTVYGTTIGVGGGSNANVTWPFNLCAVITGLTIGTPIWFDLTLSVQVGGTSTIGALTCSAFEI